MPHEKVTSGSQNKACSIVMLYSMQWSMCGIHVCCPLPASSPSPAPPFTIPSVSRVLKQLRKKLCAWIKKQHDKWKIIVQIDRIELQMHHSWGPCYERQDKLSTNTSSWLLRILLVILRASRWRTSPDKTMPTTFSPIKSYISIC